ncbi:hypothetical protein [Streptomyces pactum]|uniref:hypothetical protein n=1 Tax=Streptomyces pactum TaxID=68249 RepID=UPI001E5F6046|nr:hypothetical protein [Streptomyces pactum]
MVSAGSSARGTPGPAGAGGRLSEGGAQGAHRPTAVLGLRLPRPERAPDPDGHAAVPGQLFLKGVESVQNRVHVRLGTAALFSVRTARGFCAFTRQPARDGTPAATEFGGHFPLTGFGKSTPLPHHFVR